MATKASTRSKSGDKRNFGSVTKLPSGRYRSRYQIAGNWFNAPTTYDDKMTAEVWLASERKLWESGEWTSPADRVAAVNNLIFRGYVESWLQSKSKLKTRTREEYVSMLDRLILPRFKDERLAAIDSDMVGRWHSGLSRKTPTQNARAYSLLRSILTRAVRDGQITRNPCTEEGAASVKRKKGIGRPLSLDELGNLVAEMPERYRPMVLLAAWCALRFGELTELRRGDVDLTNGVLYIDRGVVRTKAGFEIGDPKTEAGKRRVHMPPHLIPIVREHLENHVVGANGLLFPARHSADTNLAPSTLYKPFYRARRLIGRPDLRFHDLRHTGAVLAAATGATLAELMARLGHSSVAAAMKYQHAVSERDAEIAALLSKMASV